MSGIDVRGEILCVLVFRNFVVEYNFYVVRIYKMNYRENRDRY